MSIRFYYIRDKKKNSHIRADGTPSRGNPVAVIVSSLVRDSGHVKYAISATHPKDHFEKSKGRMIALARLDKLPTKVVIQKDDNSHQITTAVMNDIVVASYLEEVKVGGKVQVNSEGEPVKQEVSVYPYRIRKLAKLWLKEAALPKKEVVAPVV